MSDGDILYTIIVTAVVLPPIFWIFYNNRDR